MKIEREKYDLKKSDDFQEVKFELDASSQELMIEMLHSNLYSNPKGSIVRELASNCVDAHTESGQTLPIEIEYVEKNKLTGQFEPSIIFRDYGPGLSPTRFKETYTKYFASTKRDDNKGIGGYGLGCKTPLAYVDSFTVRTIVDEIDYVYVVSKSEVGGVSLFKLTENEAKGKPNMTEVIVPLVDTNDKYDFEKEIINQLGYFKNVKYLGFSPSVKPAVIDYEDKDILISLNGPHKTTHIIIGNVCYPIDWKQIAKNGLSLNVQNAVALRFEIGELKLSLNRETIYYTDQTKKAIEDKIKKVAGDIFRELSVELKKETNLITLCRKLNAIGNSTFSSATWTKDAQVLSQKANFCAWRSNSSATFDFEGVTLRSAYDCFRFFSIREVAFDWSDHIAYSTTSIQQLSDRQVYFADEGELSTRKSKCIWIKGAKDDAGIVNQRQSFILIQPLKVDPTSFKTKDEEKQVMERFEKVKALLKRDCLDYENYVIDESVFTDKDKAKLFTAAELREQNSAIYAKSVFIDRVMGETSPGFTAYEPKVKDIPKHPAKTIIYGFSDDDSKLSNAAIVLLNNKEAKSSFGYTRGDAKVLCPKAEYLILKISKQNEKYFKGKHKGAIHVNDWLMKGTEELIKFYTGYKIDEVLDNYNYLTYFDQFNRIIHNKYERLSEYRNKYLDHGVDKKTTFVKNVLMYCEENGVWDQKVLRMLAEVEQYCQDLSILKYVKPGIPFKNLRTEDIDVITDLLHVKLKDVTFKKGHEPMSIERMAEIKGRSAVKHEFMQLMGWKQWNPNSTGYSPKEFYIFSKGETIWKMVAWMDKLPLVKVNLTKQVSANAVINKSPKVKDSGVTPLVDLKLVEEEKE